MKRLRDTDILLTLCDSVYTFLFIDMGWTVMDLMCSKGTPLGRFIVTSLMRRDNLRVLGV